MNERGVSTVVVITLIVLISVAGVTILWVSLDSFLKADLTTFDAQLSVVTSTGYTFYDPNKETVSLQVESGGSKAPDYLQVIITLKNGEELISVHDAPHTGTRSTLFLNLTEHIDEDQEPISISVAPIFMIDGKAILGKRIRNLKLPERAELESYYDSFDSAVSPEGTNVDENIAELIKYSSGGGGGGGGGGNEGSGDDTGDENHTYYNDTDANGFYEIYTCEELQSVRNSTEFMNQSYELMQNVNCSETITWNGGRGFIAIGSFLSEFNGDFDGNGYAISDLYISEASYLGGLFGKISADSVVKDVTLDNIDVNYSLAGGGLVVENLGTIISSHVSGEIYAMHHYYCGGIVGQNRGEVYNSSSSASVNCDNYAGSFVGQNAGSIYSSFASGNVTLGNGNGGGFVGSNFVPIINSGIAGSIENSYSAGEVNGGSKVGSFVGTNSFCHGAGFGQSCDEDDGDEWRSGPIINSYSSSGYIEGSSSMGGFVGFSRGEITNSYFDSDNLTCIGGCVGEIGSQRFVNMTNVSWLENQGWDFTGVWDDSDDGVDYPSLLWEE